MVLGGGKTADGWTAGAGGSLLAAPSSRGQRVSDRALIFGTRGAAAGAEQLQKESLMCSGLALEAQDTLLSTKRSTAASSIFH